MKYATFIVCCLFIGTVNAQDCANGVCSLPAKAVAVAIAPIQVIAEVQPVRTLINEQPVKKSTRGFIHRTRTRIRCCK
jgi:hypothetical protein